MKHIRDGERTRKRILDAAAEEFSSHGFEGARLSGIARRAKVSKQLIHHHFRSKEKLFTETHDMKFWPQARWEETLPRGAVDMFAERFQKRAKDVGYVRFLTWEAASAGNRPVPGEKERRQRIAEYASKLRSMQVNGLLPNDLDHRLIQLAILSLANYPIAFTQITRMVTGRSATDPRFQREWVRFLRKTGTLLFGRKMR
ncbi:MAG: hypothetical protein A3G24_12305 [Betaproteobacteria bacterium RIFCSPLOWO2_12_FULL_62_13]|nr:MAG: hypothetical protein A3G24_12305 [Betaproteobacteria bacterium RIFCSPLOWO2_12_FULL_62_13]